MQEDLSSHPMQPFLCARIDKLIFSANSLDRTTQRMLVLLVAQYIIHIHTYQQKLHLIPVLFSILFIQFHFPDIRDKTN